MRHEDLSRLLSLFPAASPERGAPGRSGLDAFSHIIDNGSDAPGTLLEHCSAAFRKQFAQAPLILAKGQANYETLSETQAPVFFLLQAKCAVIAGDLGVPIGSVVLKASAGMDP
ncbi:hypothetical protein Thiowin_03245 [Thiorhodovibrio winogradskyi]|uniref:Damage-control phosphatase ARMT1-like metal-binding domain-containing protein n=1 Tax=Thiorhodovibrio winogradskyi TaxID=77007 RepID=A0ABZ0SAY4_9GAMM|nr:ARMT1-like domain-containing protein [Thiorhodovibrio winogradskyi]